jgi:hypothetical protein
LFAEINHSFANIQNNVIKAKRFFFLGMTPWFVDKQTINKRDPDHKTASDDRVNTLKFDDR